MFLPTEILQAPSFLVLYHPGHPLSFGIHTISVQFHGWQFWFDAPILLGEKRTSQILGGP
jgi:hypothetical protein